MAKADILDKINLHCGADIRNGWINVDTKIPDHSNFSQDERFAIGDYSTLDTLVEDNSLSEIVLSQPINIISPVTMIEFLATANKKLKTGGKLTIWFIDIRTVGLNIYNGKLDLEQAHMLLFGRNYELKNIMTIGVITSAANYAGFKVDIISPNEYFVTLELIK